MTPFLTNIVIFVLVVILALVGYSVAPAHQCSRALDEEAACPVVWHERDRYRMRFWQIDDLHGTGGILSVTEGFLDPHHQSWEHVRHLAQAAGFVEEGGTGNRWLFTVNFLKSPTS